MKQIRIAGLNFRDNDCGCFEGVLRRDLDNQYDRDAIGIYVDETLVGYIPVANHKDINYNTLPRECSVYIDTFTTKDKQTKFKGYITIKP
jgi:hypothetical protein